MLPKKILILDTETISIDKPYIYDLGYIVAELIDNQYVAIERHQRIIEQIYDNQALFSTAYYEKKRLKYTSLMKGRKAKKNKYGFALQELNRIIQYHEIETVFAYNSPFDKRAVQFTTSFFKTQDILGSKNWLDLLSIANNFIHNTVQFTDFALKSNSVNPSGLILTNAEVTYQFITGDLLFIEDHTSLADAEIELAILNECIKNGYNNDIEYKRSFIESGKVQYLKIETPEKTYTFKYNKKIKRKNGTIVLK